ncbi:MAG: amino acid permease [Balneolaceae bacterium]|nr:amino acid permease [Balneolaceae bacterium]
MAKKGEKLEKKLTLMDVFAISTGAMFSSGFFLLPGLAASQTGSSVFLAYLLAGFLILPSMFSVAELSTAMPRAGGAYYFIDRSLGPVMGTIGGMGSWFALIFKSAFALIGMGAYIAVFIDLPIIPVAVVLTLIFGVLNIVGAKESTGLQRFLVAILITIMFFYLLQGVFKIASLDLQVILNDRFDPFFQFGPHGFLSTIGLVFVSYTGLTKVASVSEEVQNPDRNIPLGMILSLVTASIVYVVGVLLMVIYLEPSQFFQDLTPVATTGDLFMDWLPGGVGLALVVIAAAAAFASTGNAGILSASRYPFAMARDNLIPSFFGKISGNGTPVVSVIATTGTMVLLLVMFNVESVAKLASAFQLLLFALLNVAVIVMRESKIESYDPGFKSPFYPWVQIFGIFISVVLILEMGILSVLFTIAIIFVCVLWYFYYAVDKVDRQGAIFHVTARMSRHVDEGLDSELRSIMREKGLRKDDPYEAVVARSAVFDQFKKDYETLLTQVANHMTSRINCDATLLRDRFAEGPDDHAMTLTEGVCLHHVRIPDATSSELILVRLAEPTVFKELGDESLHAIIFLVSSTNNATQHLRILAHLAEVIDNTTFLGHWDKADDETDLREILLRDERFVNLIIGETEASNAVIGKKLRDIRFPGQSLVAVIRRQGIVTIPHGDTELMKGDEVSIIGELSDIEAIRKQYG